MNVVRSFVNYAIIRELCDRMRFEVDCAKSHHRVISEGLSQSQRLYVTVAPVLNCCLIEIEPYKNTFFSLVFACFVLETLLQEEHKEVIYFDSK